MRRAAWLAIALLSLSACAAAVDVGDAAPTPVEASDTASPTTAPPDPESADAEPVAPQPVTASTVHEARTDDFPDILAAQATPEGNGAWRFDVTVSSPYDTPERYADAWRVVGPDGTEYGIRVLTHDHASEQPFTRSQSGIAIPEDVTTVTVEGRDQANGWGGGTLTVNLASGE